MQNDEVAIRALERISALTPFKANASCADDLHATVKAIADTALAVLPTPAPDADEVERVFNVLWPLQEWDGEERVCRDACRKAIAALSTRTDAPDREAIARIAHPKAFQNYTQKCLRSSDRSERIKARTHIARAYAKADAILALSPTLPKASEDRFASAGKVIGREASEGEVTQGAPP